MTAYRWEVGITPEDCLRSQSPPPFEGETVSSPPPETHPAYTRRTGAPTRRPGRWFLSALQQALEQVLCLRTSSHQGVNSFHLPSEITSTAPSITLMAVSSSIAYAGPPIPAAHFSAAAIVFSGKAGLSRCGKIEKSTMPSVRSLPLGGFHPMKSSPTRGVMTMLPALSPTQIVSGSDGRSPARPDCCIQWHRYKASPPSTSRTSVSWTQRTQRSASMLGSAVSSRTPKDFHPSSHMGDLGSRPLINRQA